MSDNRPIGVLDSGLGGLSILRALRQTLPGEDFLYCADSGNAPWGDRDNDFVIERTRRIIQFLLKQGAKAIVLACNTATAAAAETVRAEFPCPIVGIEPAVKPAAKLSAAGRFGVIGTTRTITSERYHSLLLRFAQGTHVMSVATPGLMECVERGEFDTASTKRLLAEYLTPMLQAGIDTLVLACTHYPFLEKAILEVAGRPLRIIEPSQAVAAVLQTRLVDANLATQKTLGGNERFWVKDASHFSATLRQLWPSVTRIEELTA